MPDGDPSDSPSLASNRTLEIVTALLFLVASAVCIVGSLQIGAGWRDDGPAPGFFPFWVGVIMAVASVINLITALRRDAAASGSFVSRTEFGRVLAVLIPTTIYVALIGGIGRGSAMIPGLGIYVASALFILGFMMVVGREPIWKAVPVAIGVPVALFVMFERWFKVALPKGPLEAWLGLG